MQLFFGAVTNSYVTGFAAGKIYQGSLKTVCVPGLNCYSCPGALMSCPIGSLQAVIGSRSFSFSCYVFGLILLFGAFMGRMVCGFLCPFGLVQELLHRIPFPVKKKGFRGDRILRFLKYAVLVILVFLLPMLVNSEAGTASPYFCKLVCPAGTLEAGVPLVLLNPNNGNPATRIPEVSGLSKEIKITGISGSLLAPEVLGVRNDGRVYQTGALFQWKLTLLVLTLLLSVIVYRPFCKYLCPLGAMYGLMNPVALYRLRFDKEKCIRCGACARACGMGLDPSKKVNEAECVRCGDCVNACPVGALWMGFGAGVRGAPAREGLSLEPATPSDGGKDQT